MKTIKLLSAITLMLFSHVMSLAQSSASEHGATLQSIKNLDNAIYHNPNSTISKLLRTTDALGSRVTGETDLNNNGASFVYYDSLILSYSGTRGGDLNHLGTKLKFDNAYIYDYNTTTSTWQNSTYEFQTFDGSDNVLTTVAQSWNTTTNTWINSQQNLYTWAGNNLQIIISQTWDTTSNTWINSDKYIYTYDGSGNMLTEVDQTWNTSTSVWVNSEQYLYTYNSNNKVTSEIYQNWSGSAWTNQDKYTYTYDGTNTYILTGVTQEWNSGTSAWDNNSQHVYTYDIMNDQLTNLSQNWSGSAWVNSSLSTYSNFVAQLPQTEIDQSWNTGTSVFDNATKYATTYNSFNQITDQVSQTWNIGGFWESSTSDRDSRFYYQEYTTGVNTLLANNDEAIIYPIPANDVLHINVNWVEPQAFSIYIYDMQGNTVAQWSVPTCVMYQAEVPLYLPSGDYFIRFNGESAIITHQFVVVK